jgi:hypothetical protein
MMRRKSISCCSRGIVMNRGQRLVAALSALLVGVGLAAPVSAAPASSRAARSGAAVSAPTSTYTYLRTHNRSLDKNWNNYSIATRLLTDLHTVGGDQATSPLFDPGVRATFFVPTDGALRILLKQATGHDYPTERAVLNKLEMMVTPDVDNLLGFGVIPGRTLTSRALVALSGRNLRTAWTPTRTMHVAVYHWSHGTVISLWDMDHRFRNPRVILRSSNLNAGNAQIVHGIDRVALGFHQHIARSWFDPNQYALIDELTPCGPVSCPGGSPGHG